MHSMQVEHAPVHRPAFDPLCKKHAPLTAAFACSMHASDGAPACPCPPQVSSAMVSWLRGFDMEQRLLGQLVALRQRVVAAVGKGLFSGGWVVWCGAL
jgi:hypothetical protein